MPEQGIAPFTRDQAAASLQQLPAWRYDEGRRAFHRRIEFADFSEAFAFMARVALAAEKADHHPEWSNVYNRVEIWLTTHECGDVSQRDLSLASLIDQFVGS